MSLLKKNIQIILTRPWDVFSYIFPGRTSYSQSGEDMILDFLFRHKRWWFYIDVWANHPKRLSNTLFFYNQRGWMGINIEPNPTLHKGFQLFRRRDINLNIWIAKEMGELDFFQISPHTLSTFDVHAAEDYIAQWHKLVKQYKVPVNSLRSVLLQYSHNRQSIDFLSVDTEWFDMEVLESNDWQSFRPKVIVLETVEYKKNGGWKKLDKEFIEYLSARWYRIYADTYINSIFISNEYAEEIKFI